MSLFRVAALLIMCGIALSAVGKSATPQNSATKQATQPDDIPKSIAESVSGTLQFAEGNFIGLAEAMPEDKYSYVPAVGKFDGVRSFGEQVKHVACPASSILSGQRQLDFPMLVEIPAAVGAVGKVGIARVVRDFQGRWEGRKTCFWFSSLSTARLFPQPFGRRVCVVKEIIEGHFASADSKPASRFFLACSMR